MLVVQSGHFEKCCVPLICLIFADLVIFDEDLAVTSDLGFMFHSGVKIVLLLHQIILICTCRNEKEESRREFPITEEAT